MYRRIANVDGWAWTAAEVLARAGREQWRLLRPKPSLAEQWATLDKNAPECKLQALRIALRGGAYDLAARLADEIVDQPAARTLAAEALYAVGRREQAASLAPGCPDPDELARYAAEHPFASLRNPQLHLARATVQLRTGRAGFLVELNRFLRSQGLPRCSLGEDSGNLVADLRFETLRRVVTGPLVSVLVAAHNASSSITYAIDSLLGQSYRNLEVLVCEDAGEDDTLQLLKHRYSKEPRVRVFFSSANQGPYNVRNALLAHARGQFVTFQDADDLALPTRIETQVAAMDHYVASYVALVRVTAEGAFSFFYGGSAIRPAMVSLMTRRAHMGRFRSARFGADLEMREALCAHYGQHAISILRRPFLFCLLSKSSLTRRDGSESLDDGYRSPARRAYSEAVFRRYIVGDIDDAGIEATLHDTSNHAPSQPIIECS